MPGIDIPKVLNYNIFTNICTEINVIFRHRPPCGSRNVPFWCDRMKKKPSFTFLLLPALCLVLALLLCAVGPDTPVKLLGAPDPEPAAEDFLSALGKGDYAAASALCLTSLPGEVPPEDPDAAALYDVVRESWRGELAGKAVREGGSAFIPVRFTSVDADALCAGLKEDVNTLLSSYVEAAALASDIFAEDGSYRDEVVLRAWNEAFSARLERSGEFLCERELTLELRYADHRWQVVPDSKWLTAMAGGV